MAIPAMILSLATVSCGDFLSVDDQFDEMTQLDSVFRRKELVEQYIRGAASWLPNEGALWINGATPFQGASDENFSSFNNEPNNMFLRDEITEFSGYYNNYTTYYQGIRKANMVLKRINEVPDISDIDRRDFMGRCYFLRGYYIYRLLLQYGPVPLVPDEPFDVNASVETMSLERATYDECVDYICKNMETAYKLLPQKRENTADIHIPDQGACLAVMSRIRLYAASPCYNGNARYSDWKRKSDGANFISQTKDPTKWAKAAVAAKRIIDLGRYKLNTVARESDTPDLPVNVPHADFPKGAGNIDPYRSYTYVFNGELPRTLNNELIYSCEAPVWDLAYIATPAPMNGNNSINVVQDLVDAYYMADGREITNSSAEYPYSQTPWEKIGKDTIFSGYTLKGSAARMYANREMRFYGTIAFCECFWPGTSYTGSEAGYKNVTVTYYANGNAAASAQFPVDYNHTGYNTRKYMHPEDQTKTAGGLRPKEFPIFRYAETLLNYAEALNEMKDGEIYTDEETGITVRGRDANEILNAFNQIRYRAGLPGLDVLPSQDKMRRLIKHERQLEFALEGHRYLDLRRWDDAYEAYNKPVRGCNIKAKSNERELFYTPIVLNNDDKAYRSFSYKQYFYPIPKSARNKNPNLQQNPGW